MIFEKELRWLYPELECESPSGEIFKPNLMRLKADLESEGLSLDYAKTFNWEKPIVLKDKTRVYNKNL